VPLLVAAPAACTCPAQKGTTTQLNSAMHLCIQQLYLEHGARYCNEICELGCVFTRKCNVKAVRASCRVPLSRVLLLLLPVSLATMSGSLMHHILFKRLTEYDT
jgi:hypothetical protein